MRYATRLLGPGWWGIRTLRFTMRLALLLAVLLLLVMIIVTVAIDWDWLSPWWAFVALVVTTGVLVTLLSRGLATVNILRNGVDAALRMKCPAVPSNEAVTFRHIAAQTGCSLKIIATDITQRKMTVFSMATTPDTPVAEAVAASICLPLIFRPHKIDKSLYVDGGLVSNLPVWAFDAERRLDRSARTIAVQITEGAHQKRRFDRVFGVLSSTISTTLNGADLLNKRNVEYLHTLQLYDIKARLLDFDMSAERARKIILAAKNQAEARLLPPMTTQARAIQDLLKELASTAAKVIEQAAIGDAFVGKIRTALFLPEGVDADGRPHNLRNAHAFGFEDAVDELLRLPINGSFAGQAWEDGVAKIGCRDDSDNWGSSLDDPCHRWLRQQVWPELKWCLCVPFDVAPDKRMVVAVDSDNMFDSSITRNEDIFSLLATEVVTILRQFPVESLGDLFE